MCSRGRPHRGGRRTGPWRWHPREKAGLLELADIVLVNKADLDGAERHAGELRESYALDGDDAPEVLLTSGLKGLDS